MVNCQKMEKTLVTTKSDKENHGYGLRNIESSAKKYDGAVSTYFNDNMFYINVYIGINY